MSNPAHTANSASTDQHSGGLSLMKQMAALAWKRVARQRALPEFSRLWHEGVDPFKRLLVISQNHLEIRRLLASGCDVTFISSFFRSGNTWARCLLTDILLQNEGIDTSTADSIRSEKIIPDIYQNLVSQRDPIVRNSAFVKTHENFDTILSCYGKGAQRANGRGRTIYIFRQPEDSLVSFYHFRLLQQPSLGQNRDVNLFCRSELATWTTSVSSHLKGWDRGANILFISYERLLTETVTTLALMLRFLEIEHGAASVERAVSNMEFGKLRSLEEDSRKNAREYFFRQGRQGGGAKELDDDTLQFIRDSSARLMQHANERATLCRTLPHKVHRFKDACQTIGSQPEPCN